MQATAAQRSPDLESLLRLTQAPPDRLWRYPICRRLVPHLMSTPVTPNHVTAAHTLLGLSAGLLVAQGTLEAFVLAGLLFEVRAILDCLDGVLARAKKLSSPLGRTLDQLGDTIAYLSVVFGALWCLSPEYGWLSLGLAAFVFAAISASCSGAWDFFGRRFSGILRDGHDATELEYMALCRTLKQRPSVSFAFSWIAVSWQWLTLAPGTLRQMRRRMAAGDWPEPDAQPPPHRLAAPLREDAAANDPILRRVLTLVGWVAADNLMFLMSILLLMGVLPQALPGLALWGVVTWVVTVFAANRYLGALDARATSRQATPPEASP
jgi:phosphatidylglycerophosphate synthase